MTLIPQSIEAREKIVRAVVSPRHFKKGVVTSAIFRAPAGIDEISVIRHEYCDLDFCQAKGKALNNPTTSPPAEYKGLAVIYASSIVSCGSQVVDSRNVYLGHADIVHGYVPISGEPYPSEYQIRFKALLDASRYYPDLNPTNNGWTGPDPINPP